MGIFTSMIPEDADYRNAYYVVHKSLGVTIFLLVLVRLVWNKLSQRPSLDNALTAREEKLAHRAHNTLYFMMLAIPITVL
jgi:cytochrome b561